jgi:hypothetical protein
MSGENRWRRLRAAVGNALVWGAGWSAAAFAVLVTMRLAGAAPDVSWLYVVGLAARFGIVGTIAGGAFSAVIGVLYRGRRLSEISWLRFGIGGAVITGVFVPLFLQAMNLLSGDGLVSWGLVLDDAVITAAFGGVAAALSLKLAQRADHALRSGGRARLAGGLDSPPKEERAP